MPLHERGHRRWRRSLFHVGLLLLLIVGMYWKLALTRQYTWLNNEAASGLFLPWLQMRASEVHRLSFPVWDPYQWCGQPLFGQGQTGAAYPLNWLLWLFPLRHAWVHHIFLNWYFVAIHFCGAFFSYWLCRDLGRSSIASLLGGLLFTAGPFLGTSEWPAALNAANWAPAILMFFFRAQRDQNPVQSAGLCGGALGMAWLAGDNQIAALLTLVALCLWVRLAWQKHWWKYLALFGGVATGISALHLVPTLEYLLHAPGSWWSISATQWSAHAVSPLELPGIVAPQYAPDAMLYAGWAALTFAMLGFFTSWKAVHVRVLAMLAPLGLLLSFGAYSTFGGVLFGLRVLAKEPKSGLVLLALGLAVLAAFGMDACTRREPGTDAVAKALSTTLSIIGALSLVALFALSMTQGERYREFAPMAVCAIAALMTAGLVEGWRRGALTPRSASVCAILLAMWELGNVVGYRWIHAEFGWGWLQQLARNSDVVRYLRAQPEPVRVETNGIPYQFGDWTGVEQWNGLTGGTENIARALRYPAARALAGVQFSVGKDPLYAGQAPVLATNEQLRVFSLPDAAPRAFTLHRAVSAKNRAELEALLARPVADLRREGFVSGAAPALQTCEAPEPADVRPRKGNTIRVRATLHCRGLLILGETWYPGWSVSVDGKQGENLEAYGFLQSTVVAAGEHEITFSYRPYSVWIGAFVTSLTALGLVLGNVRFRRKVAP